MREIAATILVGLLGAIALTVAFVVPLMLLRSIVRYHLETEGLRVTLLSYTLWYARWAEIRCISVVSGWEILRPNFTLRLGTKLRGPGVRIKKRHGWGAVLNPGNADGFA